MPTITERMVTVNGVRLRLTEAGEPGAPVVLLAHGFPELAYSWRHQIPALADAGYRVLAPDQRGYGGSDRPAAVEDYDMAALTADLVGLLDEAGAASAVWIGHDWGASVVWSAAQLHPDRVAAVAGLSVPPVPRPRTPPTAAFTRIFGDEFFYMLYFQAPGVADAELDADPAATLHRLFGGPVDSAAAPVAAPAGFLDRLPAPTALPGWLSQAEFDRYVGEFTRTGFTGGLNWYRNLDRNWALLADAPAASITVPALFLGGTHDPVLAFTRRDRARELVTGDYREVLFDGAGHWLQQERPAEVNAALLEFLAHVRR